MLTTYAEDGEQCSWCDCPDDPTATPSHRDPGFVCPGCPADAFYVVTVFAGSPNEQRLPVCESHWADVSRFLATALPDVSAEVRWRPIRDDDMHG